MKDEFVVVILVVVNLLVMVFFMYFMVSMVGGCNFGFVNCFDEVVVVDVCWVINCLVEGYVNLYCWLNGSL